MIATTPRDLKKLVVWFSNINFYIPVGNFHLICLELMIFYYFLAKFIFDWEKNHEPLEKEKIAELFELYLLKGLSN